MNGVDFFGPNDIHPESRARAITLLRKLADRLEEGGRPVGVFAWVEAGDSVGALRSAEMMLVGDQSAVQAYLLTFMQAAMTAEMVALEVAGRVERYRADGEPSL